MPLMNRSKTRAMTKAERDKITKRNYIHSPLLRLPAELKDLIFAYVFGGQTIYVEYIRNAIHQRLMFVLQPPEFPVLRSWSYILEPLLLCRHVYEEAKLHFYVHNIFIFRHEDSLEMFMQKRTEKQINAIASLKPPPLLYERVRDGTTFRNEPKTFKARFPNLKTLYLEEAWGQGRRTTYSATDEGEGRGSRTLDESPDAIAERMQEVEGGTISIMVQTKQKDKSSAERVNDIIRQFEDGVIRWPRLS